MVHSVFKLRHLRFAEAVDGDDEQVVVLSFGKSWGTFSLLSTETIAGTELLWPAMKIV